MPYKVVKRGGGARPYKILSKHDGWKVVGSSTTRKKAQASVRARYWASGGR